MCDYAYNGEEALKKIIKRKEDNVDALCEVCQKNISYKIILIDDDMPLKDGYQTVSEIQ